MKTKRMFLIGLITLAAFAVIVSSISYAPALSAGQPPVNECPPGNLVAGKGCKWDLGFHKITSVKFDAYRTPGGDSCSGGFEFSPYDYESDLVGAPHFWGYVAYGTNGEDGQIRVRIKDSDTDGFKQRGQPGKGSLIIHSSRSYKLGSQLPSQLSLGAQNPPYDFPRSELLLNGYMRIHLEDAWRRGVIEETSQSPWLPIPTEVNDFSELVYECLEDIRREQENQAMQEELRAKNAAEQRAADKAAADAKAKAELQQIELEAAKQIQQQALETEFFKTQALRAQLEQEKLIIAAWKKVVEIRLAGAQERAKITNAFMAEVEANKAAFVASVQAKVEELRRLQQINETLHTAIQAHNQTILDELSIQQALEDKQKQTIQDLEVQQPTLTAPPVN